MEPERLRPILAPLAASLDARCLLVDLRGRAVLAVQGGRLACPATLDRAGAPRCPSRECPFAGEPHLASVRHRDVVVAHLFWCSGPRRTDRRGLADGIAATISALVGLEENLESVTTEMLERSQESTLLHELTSALSGVFETADIARTVLRLGMEALGAAGGFLLLHDAAGGPAPVTTLGALPAGIDALWTDHALWKDLAGDGGPRIVDRLDRLGSASVLVTPVHTGATVLGYLGFVNRRDGSGFVPEDSRLAVTLELQAGAAIHTGRLVREVKQGEGFRSELEIARRMQQLLLPQTLPAVEGLELAASCQPASHVGGDYYDAIPLGAGWVALVVADVSGHGVGAGLMLTAFRTALLAELSRELSPGEILRRLNALMYRDLDQAQMFVSAFLAVYEPIAGSLAYANAGHNPPRVWRRGDGALDTLDADNVPIGVFADTAFADTTVALEPGDVLLLYTDGLTEGRSVAGEMFGERRLDDGLAAAAPHPAGDVLAGLLRAFARHTAGAEIADDVTLVVGRRTE